MRFAHLAGGVVDQIVLGDVTFAERPDIADWRAAPDEIYIGCKWTGTEWTDENDATITIDTATRLRPGAYILSGSQWVDRFTDSEWSWLKKKRNEVDGAGDPTPAAMKLDKLMDAVRWTDSINVEPGASDQADAFYQWLLDNNIPGGQTRIDELRAPR